MNHFKSFCIFLLLLTISVTVWSGEDDSDLLPLSPDSLKVSYQINQEDDINQFADQSRAIGPSQNLKVTGVYLGNDESHSGQTNIHVLLIPQGEINSSYKSALDLGFIYQLRNAINRTQLNNKSEADYVPIATSQTVEHIQKYLASTVQRQLSECQVLTRILNDESVDNDRDQLGAYLYQVDLGVKRLVVTKGLLSSKLNGEASATIIENNKLAKNFSVSSYSFADKDLLLNHYSDESIQRDDELKNVSTRVVDRLGERLGHKLCQFFN